MARQELTTNGLKLYRDAEGLHWLQLGENVALCLENLSQGEIINEQLRIWLSQQSVISEESKNGRGPA